MKKKILILLSIIHISLIAFTQQKIIIQIHIPNQHLSDPYYIAGDFNDWNPNLTSYQLKK